MYWADPLGLIQNRRDGRNCGGRPCRRDRGNRTTHLGVQLGPLVVTSSVNGPQFSYNLGVGIGVFAESCDPPDEPNDPNKPNCQADKEPNEDDNDLWEDGPNSPDTLTGGWRFLGGSVSRDGGSCITLGIGVGSPIGLEYDLPGSSTH